MYPRVLFYSILSLIMSWNVATSQDESSSGVLPPPSFFVDVIMKYLKIPDVVISIHENSNLPMDDYVIPLYEQDIFTSVFEWNDYEDTEEQFSSFIRVVSSGKQLTIVFFMDDISSQIFFQHAYNVKYILPLPCFYRWVFFDVNGITMKPLHRFNTSAVCWKTIFVTTVQEDETNATSKWSLFGPSLTPYGNCLLTNPLGDWSPSRPFQKLRLPNIKIHDFQGRTLRTSVLDVQPFYAQTENGFEGIEYELLTTLKDKLNFRIKLMNNTDGEQGRKLANGTWTGYVGLIHEGKAVFTISALSISIRRMKAVDFTSPYLYGKLGFVVVNPALLGRKLVLIKPLTPTVWVILLSTLCVCTGALYLITHSLPCKSGVRNAYNIWFLLRTLGQQGTPSPAPDRYSIRFFISFWWMFILVILWSYSGILTSFMTYPGRRPAVDTVHKLLHALKTGHIRYGTTKGTTYDHFLKTDMADVDPVFRDSLEDPAGFQVRTVAEGMDLVLKEKYAFVYLTMVLKWYTARLGESRFRISKDVFGIDAMGVAIQKCHPCKKSFNHIIDRLEETGFFTKWYDDEFVKATIKGSPLSVKAIRPLSLDDLQGAFYLGGIGMGIALVSFIAEVCIAKLRSIKCTKRKRRKKQKMRKLHMNPTFTYWITGFQFESLNYNKQH